ncbi:MAG: hypothetical protein WCG14_03670 [Chlamydiia bacterium]
MPITNKTIQQEAAPYSSNPPCAQGLKQSSSWTTQQTQKLAYVAIGALGVMIGSAAYARESRQPLAGLAFIFAAYAGSELLALSFETDYEDPKTIEGLQLASKSMGFSDLINQHGLAKVRQYAIATPDDLQKKCNADLQGLDLATAVTEFHIDELQEAGLVTDEVKNLADAYKKANSTLAEKKAALSLQYPQRKWLDDNPATYLTDGSQYTYHLEHLKLWGQTIAAHIGSWWNGLTEGSGLLARLRRWCFHENMTTSSTQTFIQAVDKKRERLKQEANAWQARHTYQNELQALQLAHDAELKTYADKYRLITSKLESF